MNRAKVKIFLDQFFPYRICYFPHKRCPKTLSHVARSTTTSACKYLSMCSAPDRSPKYNSGRVAPIAWALTDTTGIQGTEQREKKKEETDEQLVICSKTELLEKKKKKPPDQKKKKKKAPSHERPYHPHLIGP